MIQPNVEDLLAIVGLLTIENDAYRLELGFDMQGHERVYNQHDMQRGRSVGPVAEFDDPDHLRVRLES
jgi:hypothetical protein